MSEGLTRRAVTGLRLLSAGGSASRPDAIAGIARGIGAREIQVPKQRRDEMKSRTTVTRREFTVASALAVLSGVTISVTSSSDTGHDHVVTFS